MHIRCLNDTLTLKLEMSSAANLKERYIPGKLLLACNNAHPAIFRYNPDGCVVCIHQIFILIGNRESPKIA